MEASNLVKVVAAFVAGIVIALGSALIYVRVSEMAPLEPVALAQPATDLPQLAPNEPAATVHEALQPVNSPPNPTPPLAQPHTAATPLRHLKRSIVKLIRHRQPKIPMAKLAQNRAPVTEPVHYAALQLDPQPAAPSAEAASQIPDPPLPQQPHVVTLVAGTAVPIRLSEALSSDHNYTGDTFRATLDAPIIMDGFIIADRGSKVLGRVISSERAGRMEGAAELSVTLTEINTTDGQRVLIDTNSLEQKGSTSMGQDAATIAGGAALGAIIGAAAAGAKGAAVGAGLGGAAGTTAVFASHPRPAALPVESKLLFRLATPLTITEKLN